MDANNDPHNEKAQTDQRASSDNKNPDDHHEDKENSAFEWSRFHQLSAYQQESISDYHLALAIVKSLS